MNRDLILPDLKEGEIYQHEEVRQYIHVDQEVNSDYWIMVQHFPWEVTGRFDHDGLRYRRDEPVLLQYRLFPLTDFDTQLRQLQGTFDQHDAWRDRGECVQSAFWKKELDRARVEKIVEKLMSGEPVYPVFVQQDDPQRRILEGMHRTIAVQQLGGTVLPVFLAGYRDWFDG
jgi:hypothetical protein